MTTIPARTVGADGQMPVIGLGLWKIHPDHVADAVVAAIRAGYRHLDSACDYGNEKQVGEGIRRAIGEGLCTREELWVTSKLWNTYHHPDHVILAMDQTLEDLALDYLDLYLVHFPIALEFVPFETRYPPEWVHDPSDEVPMMKPAVVPLRSVWARRPRKWFCVGGCSAVRASSRKRPGPRECWKIQPCSISN